MNDTTVNTYTSWCGYASGAPSFVWSMNPGSTLPTGLTFSSSGCINGTPTAVKVYRFLIRAAEDGNPSNYSVRELILNVTPLQLTANSGIPWNNVNGSVNLSLTVTGATGAVSWSLAPVTLSRPG